MEAINATGASVSLLGTPDCINNVGRDFLRVLLRECVNVYH